MGSWKIILFPFAWLYGIAVRLRHWFFDVGILSSEQFSIPLIVVGNISVGGTGKTPLVEYLIKLLLPFYNVAVLSRGYKRKTRSFIKGNQFSKQTEIGDEPMQYLNKFGNKVTVAVDEKRVHGIHSLLENNDALDVILLDDAFQHRYVKPGISILLTDYFNLYMEDYLIPVGKLRDVKTAARRADIILVTKAPKVLSPITRKRITNLLKPVDRQKVFFSYLKYDKLLPANEFTEQQPPEKLNAIVLFSGVANSYPLQEHLERKCRETQVIDFKDHHVYRRKDMELVKRTFDNIFTRNKIIVTTEKDMMRLKDSPYFSALKNLPVYYLPVRMKINKEDEYEFNKAILDYVEQNRGNR
ncbi:MAG: tetraacyldisaccharide 4'-kinase [Chlorobi bacterium]|nr:tetraacyldisaccharide 4'-kinase [Chlorobiota bacterium]